MYLYMEIKDYYLIISTMSTQVGNSVCLAIGAKGHLIRNTSGACRGFVRFYKLLTNKLFSILTLFKINITLYGDYCFNTTKEFTCI